MSGVSASAPLRRIASAVIPQAGKHAIDNVRARWFLRRIAPINEEYVRRYGLEVRRGPFAGLTYVPGQEHISGHLIAKLVGAYEYQIQPWFAEWIAGDFDLVIDVGCAEGFYAVGLARAMPNVEVRAYDLLDSARSYCERLARANGVENRVIVGEACTPDTLAEMSASRVALLSDCEGYEKVLLDPERAPCLRRWSIIVEQHDCADPTISSTIRQRFQKSHEIEVVDYVPASCEEYPELEWLSKKHKQLVLAERPLAMSWALLRPRETSS